MLAVNTHGLLVEYIHVFVDFVTIRDTLQWNTI